MIYVLSYCFIILKLIFVFIFPFNIYLRFVPGNDGGAVSPKRNPSILSESRHLPLVMDSPSADSDDSAGKALNVLWVPATLGEDRFNHVLPLLP